MTVTPLAAELVQRTSRSEAIELREQLFVVGPGGGSSCTGRRVVDVGRGGEKRRQDSQTSGLDPPRCMAVPNKCTHITEMKVDMLLNIPAASLPRRFWLIARSDEIR